MMRNTTLHALALVRHNLCKGVVACILLPLHILAYPLHLLSLYALYDIVRYVQQCVLYVRHCIAPSVP